MLPVGVVSARCCGELGAGSSTTDSGEPGVSPDGGTMTGTEGGVSTMVEGEVGCCVGECTTVFDDIGTRAFCTIVADVAAGLDIVGVGEGGVVAGVGVSTLD
jgi:hypothetical protein